MDTGRVVVRAAVEETGAAVEKFGAKTVRDVLEVATEEAGLKAELDVLDVLESAENELVARVGVEAGRKVDPKLEGAVTTYTTPGIGLSAATVEPNFRMTVSRIEVVTVKPPNAGKSVLVITVGTKAVLSSEPKK